MNNTSHSLLATPFVVMALWAVPNQLPAAEGSTSGGASTCMVTVITTNEDGSTDNSVRPFQARCRNGQSNGDIEYYNPYTDTYETGSTPRIDPLVIPRGSSSGSRSGTGTSQGGTRGTTGSTTGSSTSRRGAGSSGAPCTSSATSSKAVKTTRSTRSGRPCTSTLQ